jgi:hypothetical protein
MDRAQLAHNQLITPYGKRAGRVCEKCASLVSPRRKGDNRRCTLSDATNWRDSWEACGRYREGSAHVKKIDSRSYEDVPGSQR